MAHLGIFMNLQHAREHASVWQSAADTARTSTIHRLAQGPWLYRIDAPSAAKKISRSGFAGRD